MSRHPHENHERASAEMAQPEFGIIVASSSRYNEVKSGKDVTDESGDRVVAAATKAGFKVTFRTLVDDEIHEIRYAILKSIVDVRCDVCVVVGGTGISRRDVTVEATRPLLDKSLPGFAVRFQLESIEQVGSSAMISRAMAGVLRKSLVICLPGSPEAVDKGMEILIPAVKHMLFIARKD